MLMTYNNTETKKQWIDVVKGIGILLVIYGHTTNNPAHLRFIYLFHMPLFFLVNGLTLKIVKISEEAKKSFKRLMIPYIVISVIFICHYLLHKQTYQEFIYVLPRKIPTLIYGASGAQTNDNNAVVSIFDGVGRVWFLMALFTTRLIAVALINIFIKYSFSLIIQLLVMLSLAFTGMIIGISGQWLPLSLDVAMVAVFFLWLGYVMKDKINESYKFEIIIAALSFSALFLLFANTTVNLKMDQRIYTNPVICLISGILGCALVVFLRNVC